MADWLGNSFAINAYDAAGRPASRSVWGGACAFGHDRASRPVALARGIGHDACIARHGKLRAPMRDEGPIPPHRLYRDFLPEEEHDALLADAIAWEPALRPSQLLYGKVDGTIRSSRGFSLSAAGDPVASKWPREVKKWRDTLRERLTARMPDLCAGAGMKPFPVSAIELELVVYGDGARFDAHCDTVRAGEGKSSDRLVTCVYYFHASPKGFSGGALRLHRFGTSESRPGDFVDVEPERNSLLVFPAWATHEVTPVHCSGGAFRDSRFALNCWLHRRRE